MPKPSDYFLSDADNAAIFEEQIRPAEFGDSPSDGSPSLTAAEPSTDQTGHRPICIILAGQTGAGKSHAAPALAAALAKLRSASSERGPSYCHLVADTHKPYHPAYAGLVADAASGRVPPGLASAATGHDARRWLARACAVAASRGLPTLVESASRYPQDVVDMAGIFHRQNYRVCLVLLAAHPVQSRLGLLARFLDAKKETQEEQTTGQATAKKAMPARLTPRPIHDESYVGLAELATLLDQQGSAGSGTPLADAVLILRRGNQVAYTNYWVQGDDSDARKWQTTPPGVSRALSTEREKKHWNTNGATENSPLAVESRLFASDVVRLRETHPGRAAELDTLAAEYGEVTDHREVDGKEVSYHVLNPDALVAHLQSEC